MSIHTFFIIVSLFVITQCLYYTEHPVNLFLKLLCSPLINLDNFQKRVVSVWIDLYARTTYVYTCDIAITNITC